MTYISHRCRNSGAPHKGSFAMLLRSISLCTCLCIIMQGPAGIIVILINTTGLMISLACENVFSLVSLLLLLTEKSEYCSRNSSHDILFSAIIYCILYPSVYNAVIYFYTILKLLAKYQKGCKKLIAFTSILFHCQRNVSVEYIKDLLRELIS